VNTVDFVSPLDSSTLEMKPIENSRRKSVGVSRKKMCRML